MKDLRILPKVRDSWSYLYVEHARIDQEDKGICLHDAKGRVHVPCASLSLLMLGPGTTVTHAAVMSMAHAGCLIAWCGEQGIRFYAQGMGETRSAANLLQQARMWADPQHRLRIVRRMYEIRFPDPLDPGLTLRQIRGKEGARVRAAYAQASEKYGIPWSGRSYDRTDWDQSDPVNRALSAANACLYGVCHAAIVAAGYSLLALPWLRTYGQDAQLRLRCGRSLQGRTDRASGLHGGGQRTTEARIPRPSPQSGSLRSAPAA